MSLSPRLERARVDLEALATRDVPLAELVDLLHRRFVRAVPSAAGYFLTVDPSTMLPTGGVVQGFPAEACAPFWRAEFTGDLLPFAELAQADLAGSLHDTPPSALRASERYASLLQPAGMHDELRVAFVAGGSCWGVGGWVRRADAAPFRDEEVELARRISEPVARGLRGRMLMEQSECPDHDMAMLLLDGEGRVQSRNRNLDAWLDELSTVQGIDDGELPSLMNLLAAQAVAVQAQGRGPDPCVRVRGRSGRWATVRASALQGGHAAVAIVIQAAEATELAPWLLQAYGLTPREIEVVGGIARGEGNQQIASRLELSVHTVKDHVKSIYAKTGVGSRSELLCQIYDGGVHEQLVTTVRHVS